MSVGERLRRAREKLKKRQQDIADEVGVTQPAVAGWESDDFSPRPDQIRTVAKAYGLKPEQLLPEAA